MRSRASVCRWWAKNALSRAVLDDLELAQLGVVHAAQRLRPLAATARSRRTCTRFENQLPIAARGPARAGR